MNGDYTAYEHQLDLLLEEDASTIKSLTPYLKAQQNAMNSYDEAIQIGYNETPQQAYADLAQASTDVAPFLHDSYKPVRQLAADYAWFFEQAKGPITQVVHGSLQQWKLGDDLSNVMDGPLMDKTNVALNEMKSADSAYVHAYKALDAALARNADNS